MNTINISFLFEIARVALGLTLLVFGLNGFFNFFPLPDTTPEAKEFLDSLWKSGYLMHIEKAMEVAVGLLLLLKRFVPMALLIFFPIALNIALVDTFLQPQYWYYGSSIFLLVIVLMIQYHRAYLPMLFHKHERLPMKEFVHGLTLLAAMSLISCEDDGNELPMEKKLDYL
jgi:putative oxidoreductase